MEGSRQKPPINKAKDVHHTLPRFVILMPHRSIDMQKQHCKPYRRPQSYKVLHNVAFTAHGRRNRLFRQYCPPSSVSTT